MLKIALIIAAILLAVLVIGCVAVTAFLFDFALHRKKAADVLGDEKALGGTEWGAYIEQIREGAQWIIDNTGEEIYIKSRDGLKLFGRFIPAKVDTGVTFLLFHGFHSDALIDFSCVAKFYCEQGYNLFIVDQRTHGKSEGKYVGFGVLERYDVLSWIDYINEKMSGQKIFLDGVSMGSTTVMMAAGLGLPENVRGIVADCGFTSPWEQFCHVLKSWYKLPKFPILYLANACSKLFAGYGFKDCSTIDAMKQNEIPMIFIHGGADNFVPTRMTHENYEVCAAPKKLFIVEKAGHALSYILEVEKCQKMLTNFVKENV